MDEDRSSTRPEHDQRSKSARFPLARPRNPLLDRSAARSAATKPRSASATALHRIRNISFVGKTHERSGFERSHPSSPKSQLDPAPDLGSHFRKKV